MEAGLSVARMLTSRVPGVLGASRHSSCLSTLRLIVSSLLLLVLGLTTSISTSTALLIVILLAIVVWLLGLLLGTATVVLLVVSVSLALLAVSRLLRGLVDGLTFVIHLNFLVVVRHGLRFYG